jgi:hypothetical protein
VKYALFFWLLAIALIALAITQPMLWLQLAIAYVALTFVLVGCVYALGRPRMFGKTPAGKQSLISWLAFGLFFLLSRLTLSLYRRVNHNQPPLAQVTTGLWFGRRLNAKEAKRVPVEFAGVLDLAGEFPRAPVNAKAYRSLPLLDGMPVSEGDLRTALTWLEETMERGPVLVHCALGHGRTGSVVLVWLLSRGQISTLEEGIARLKELRSGFGISAAQRERLEQFVDVSSQISRSVRGE